MKLDWKAVLGGAITVFLLWWILREVDFAEVWTEVRRAHWGYLLAAVFVATAGFLVRALRWKVLLAPLKPDTTLRSRFAAVNIGFMANNLLPARVGEFARAYAFSRLEPVTVSGAFGSLVVERFLDGLVLVAFLLLAVSAPTFPAAASVQEGPIGAALDGIIILLGAMVVVLAVLLIWPGPVVRAAERVAARLPGDFARPVVSSLEAFLDSLAVLRSPVLLVKAVLWSVAFWTWHGLSFWLGFKAFAIDLDFVAAIFTEAVVGFGVAVPSAPGFFGTFHAAADWALSGVYEVEPARSLAFAFGYHLGGFIPVTAIGLWYAWRIGLTVRDVEASEERVEEAVELAHPEVASLLGQPAVGGRKPRRSGEAVTVEAPAKVNLHLRVLAREASGYHGIESLFQAVDLADRLTVTPAAAGPVELEVDGPDLGPAEDNLAVRAAEAFRRAAGVEDGLRIRLEKSIPAGAGLGGGSSDAAATLHALNHLYDRPLSREVLLEMASGLGSDVAFFLCGSPLAVAWGRGELLLALPPLPPAPLILALPGVHVSTADAYRALAEHREAEGWTPPSRGWKLNRKPRAGWSDVAGEAANDFESVVPRRHPEVARALEALRETGPRVALLAGSGGASFAVYDDEAAADRAMEALEASLRGVTLVRTRTRTGVPEPRVRPAGGARGEGAAGDASAP